MRKYTEEECWRKANQHWEMAGLARQDRDFKDANRHTEAARKWEVRARLIHRGEEPCS